MLGLFSAFVVEIMVTGQPPFVVLLFKCHRCEDFYNSVCLKERALKCKHGFICNHTGFVCFADLPNSMFTAKHADDATLRRIAKLFYRDKQTHLQIAEHFGIEVRNVSKSLEEAERRGIVKIEIPEIVESGAYHELKRWFKLEEIIAIPPQEKYVDLLAEWGHVAANYFEKVTARNDHHVGVTGGGAVLEFCDALGKQRRDNVHIHTTALIGRGLEGTASHIDPLVNATVLWGKCGRVPGHCHYATVPPYGHLDRQSMAKELDELVLRKPVRDAIERMDEISIAFGSLGLITPAPWIKGEDMMIDLLKPIVTPQELIAEGAFADLAYCPFDREGQGDPRWRFFLTAGALERDAERQGIGFYRKMVRDDKKVAVIAGTKKQEAIYAALKGGIFNVWITDTATLDFVYQIATKANDPHDLV